MRTIKTLRVVKSKAKALLLIAYRKNLINTIDYIEYAKRLNGFYGLDIIKKLESLLKKSKGEVSIFGIVGLVYLGFMLVVLLVIF